MTSNIPAIDWPKAKVDESSTLTVPIKGASDLGPGWEEALEFVAGVRNNEAHVGDWASIQIDAAAGVITVEDVGQGSEKELAEALDSLISSAHTAAVRAAEARDDAETEGDEDEPDGVAKAQAMQKAFRNSGAG